jgi:glycosyltransferase involved in cell wall biosynthesis
VRILHVVTLVDDRSSYGGPLTVAINQCRELIRRGHDASILAGWRGSGAPPTDLEGVPAHLFPVRDVVPGMRFSGLFSAAMCRWLWHEAPKLDVAHLHLARDLVPLSAGLVLRRRAVPFTTQTHGMVVPDRRPAARLLDRAMTVRVLRGARTRFILTDREQRDLAAVLGTAGTTTYLPNGVDVVTARRRTGQAFDVLFMARLHPRKRVMDFAQAARTMIRERADVRFSVVGPDDGDLPRLREFIAAYPELDGRLNYEGALPHSETTRRLREATAFVLPSVDEPFPMTLLEALAAGTPSICTTSCGLAPVLAENAAAVVIEPGAEALEAALRPLLQDRPQRERLAFEASNTARKHFSMETVGSMLLRSYHLSEPVHP